MTNNDKALEQYKTVPFAKPITSAMKADCIGEFTFETEEPRFNEDGEFQGDTYTRENVVPWDTCKKIYKAMLESAPYALTPQSSADLGSLRAAVEAMKKLHSDGETYSMVVHNAAITEVLRLIDGEGV